MVERARRARAGPHHPRERLCGRGASWLAQCLSPSVPAAATLRACHVPHKCTYLAVLRWLAWPAQLSARAVPVANSGCDLLVMLLLSSRSRHIVVCVLVLRCRSSQRRRRRPPTRPRRTAPPRTALRRPPAAGASRSGCAPRLPPRRRRRPCGAPPPTARGPARRSCRSLSPTSTPSDGVLLCPRLQAEPACRRWCGRQFSDAAREDGASELAL